MKFKFPFFIVLFIFCLVNTSSCKHGFIEVLQAIEPPLITPILVKMSWGLCPILAVPTPLVYLQLKMVCL
jgi:hypothetical protein